MCRKRKTSLSDSMTGWHEHGICKPLLEQDKDDLIKVHHKYKCGNNFRQFTPTEVKVLRPRPN